MKKNLALFLLVALLIGCDSKQNNTYNAGTAIPLDDNVPGSHIDTARNFYFVFDGSGSMSDHCEGVRKIDAAKRAVATFLAKVSSDVNLGLYCFDSNGEREVVSLRGNNRDQFLSAINDMNAGGGTPLAEGIRAATDKLVAQYKSQLGYGEYRLVVVTDGEASGLESASAYAGQYQIPIYTIGFCMNRDHPLRLYSVSYKAANNEAELAKGLEEALGELPDFDATDWNDK